MSIWEALPIGKCHSDAWYKAAAAGHVPTCTCDVNSLGETTVLFDSRAKALKYSIWRSLMCNKNLYKGMDKTAITQKAFNQYYAHWVKAKALPNDASDDECNALSKSWYGCAARIAGFGGSASAMRRCVVQRIKTFVMAGDALAWGKVPAAPYFYESEEEEATETEESEPEEDTDDESEPEEDSGPDEESDDDLPPVKRHPMWRAINGLEACDDATAKAVSEKLSVSRANIIQMERNKRATYGYDPSTSDADIEATPSVRRAITTEYNEIVANINAYNRARRVKIANINVYNRARRVKIVKRQAERAKSDVLLDRYHLTNATSKRSRVVEEEEESE